MGLKSYAYWMIAFASLTGLLWLANLPRRWRHWQYWLPGAAAGFVLTVLAGYLDYLEPLWNLLAALLQRVGIAWTPVTGDFPIFTNLMALAVFLVIKGASLSSFSLFAWIRKIFSRRTTEAAGASIDGGQMPPARFSWAYERHPERGVVLRREWVFPGVFLNLLGCMLFLLLAVCAFQLVRPLPLPLPKFPALSLLLVLEMAWYLGGLRPLDQEGEITGAGVASERLADYTALWEEYQAIWPERVLAACHLQHAHPDRIPEAAVPQGGETAEKQEIQAVISSLRLQGFLQTPMQQNLIDQLWQGHDVIITDAWNDEMAPILLAYLGQTWLEGRRAAVITETTEQQQALVAWLNRWLLNSRSHLSLRQATDYATFCGVAELADVLVLTIDELTKPGISQDFVKAEIQTVVIVQASRTLGHRLGTIQAFLQRLNAVLQDRVHYVILGSERYGLESAMRRNITLDAGSREFKLTRPAAKSVFAILWSAEAEARWQSRLMTGQVQDYLGAETVLATLAWRDGIQAVLLVQHETLPLKELLQKVDNNLALLNAHPRLNNRLHGSAHQAMSRQEASWLCDPVAQGVIILRDEGYNLAAALGRWQTRGSEMTLLLIVSPPYLLRDYLVQNAAYFLTAPLQALAPRIMKSRFTIAFTLLQRLIAAEISENEVLTELREIYPTALKAPDQLAELFRQVFHLDVVRLSLLNRHRRQRFDEAQKDFSEEVTLSLDARILQQPGLSFLVRFSVIDTHHTCLEVISADHLLQCYLPGQVHTFQGMPYKIIRYDPAHQAVHVEHCPLEGEVQYRPEVWLTLGSVQELYYAGHQMQQQRGSWTVRLHLREGDFTICRPGFFIFRGEINLTPTGHKFESLSREVAPPRGYQNGRLLTIDIRNRDGSPRPEADRIAFTLAALLNEAFYTLFPESHGFLQATTALPEDFLAPESLKKFFPQLVCPPAAQAQLFPENPPEATGISLIIVEDSQIDLGLVQCLFDDWQYVFMVLEDYLAWLLEDEVHEPKEGWRHPECDKQRFLKYGFPDLPAAFDLPGTLRVLREMGPYQVNSPCCQFRRQFYVQSPPSENVPGEGTAHRCDFCGGEISGSEVERLQDGRERCLQCKASAIDTVPDLSRIFEEGREFFVKSLGLPLRRSLQVAFTDTQTLHQAAGSYFLPTVEYDDRMVGLAVQEGNAFKILIENGQPYHLTLATVVHELTHIWQYDHLDVKRMQAEHGKLLIEGLAIWAELACLEEKHLAPAYRQLQADRGDDYGQGYRLVLQLSKEKSQVENPFITLRRLYPISDPG